MRGKHAQLESAHAKLQGEYEKLDSEYEKLKLLLEKREKGSQDEVNKADDSGETALYRAFFYGHLEVVRTLLDAKRMITSHVMKARVSIALSTTTPRLLSSSVKLAPTSSFSRPLSHTRLLPLSMHVR